MVTLKGIGLTILLLFTLVMMLQVYRVLRIYILYKRRYGNQIEFLFFPFLGLIYYMNKSLKYHDDGSYFIKQICREKPHVKAIIILSGLFNYFIALDNDWIKYLSQDQDQFYKNDGCYGYNRMFGQSLFFTVSKVWKRQRILLNSSFHYDALKSKVPIIKEESKNFCKDLQPEKGFVKIDIFDETQNLTSEVLARSFFNRQFKNKFCKNGKQLSHEIADITEETYSYRLSSLYFNLKASFLGNTGASFILNSPTEKRFLDRIDDVMAIIEQNVDQSIVEVTQTGVDIYQFEPRNFIEVYIKEYLIQQKNIQNLKQDEIITKREIIEQYMLFFFAGTDTTSFMISMTLYGVANHPAVYANLMKEIEESVKSFDDFNHQDLLKLNYLDAVIKESNRLYSAGPFVFPRRINQDYSREDLYLIKDLSITYKITQFSEVDELFKDSDSFIPERFMNGKHCNPYEMIPFSSGARNCIGQHLAILEAKYILLYILKNFEIKPVPNYILRRIQQVLNLPQDKELILIKKK